MNEKCAGANYGGDDLIAAFATTPGSSALTLIRCSGNGAINAAASFFSAPDKIMSAGGNTIVHGWIVFNGEKTDEVLVSVFRSPKSYTGEDSLDICCHGGSAAGKAVMEVLKKAGFRGALPGEFTFRAFMNGKLDLTRSESVMELVSAKTETGRRHAVSRLCGSLENEINEIKKMLVQVLAGAEIFLDYSEDEITADADEKEGMLAGQDIALCALEKLEKLSASWQLERLYQEGVTAVIAGRPNSGKSSLFNALLKEDRSIVTDVAGTTRDWIEAWVNIEGIPVRLVDTAGLREADDSSVDAVEKIGVGRSRQIIDEAKETGLVLYLINDEYAIYSVDGNKTTLDKKGGCHLFVWSKIDISPLPADMAGKALGVSAKTGEGIAELYAAIASAIRGQHNDETGSVSVGTQRQKKLVDAACDALREALSLARNKQPLDLIAPLVREAVNCLGEITGEVSTADILEEMFSRFCVGK